MNTEAAVLTAIRITTGEALLHIHSRKEWVDLLRGIREDCNRTPGEKMREILEIIDEALFPAVSMDELYHAIRVIREKSIPDAHRTGSNKLPKVVRP
jgi:hypothetical protein